MKKIYIVILNYNGYEDTLICLKSLSKLFATGDQLYTIIVDNGSTDGSVEQFKSQSANWRTNLKIDKIIENQKNLGFAKGNNIGIKYALDKGADYVLLLNNDTKIIENFLPRLLNIDADISSPVVKFREFPKSKNWMYDYGGVVNWSTGRTTHLNKSSKPNPPVGEVDYVAGCCMLIRRNVFETIGLLDETYFIYFEDVDFCITAKKKGMRVVVDPASFIYHKLGGSMDRWSKRAIFYNLLGNFIFITKHLGWRRPTGYAYLAFLTLKIIKDRAINKFKI